MIDWDRVQALRDEVGADDFAEVVDLFLEEVDEALGGLTARLAPAALSAALHFLKGSALNLGFAEFARLCQIGEKNPEKADLAAIQATYTVSKAALAKGLARLPLSRTG
jgi:HPt (histidine-containing phosphotransfer) domain-containing protein